jgi:hypothetical protein
LGQWRFAGYRGADERAGGPAGAFGDPPCQESAFGVKVCDESAGFGKVG